MGKVSYQIIIDICLRWVGDTELRQFRLMPPSVVNCSMLQLKSYCAYQLLFTISLFCDRFQADSVELALILTPSIDFDYLDRMQPKGKLPGKENFCRALYILIFCFVFLFLAPKMHRVANAQYFFC